MRIIDVFERVRSKIRHLKLTWIEHVELEELMVNLGNEIASLMNENRMLRQKLASVEGEGGGEDADTA